MYPVRIMFWMSLIWIIVEETTSALLFDILCTLYADTSAPGESKNGKLTESSASICSNLMEPATDEGQCYYLAHTTPYYWRTWFASRFMMSSSLLLLAMAFAAVSPGKSHELNR